LSAESPADARVAVARERLRRALDGDPRSIVVRGPNWAGDVVMATPGLRALRAGFPQARITLLLRRGLLPLVAGGPWIDDAVPTEARGGDPGALLREARGLRARRFDLGLSLPDSFSSALLLRLGGVRHVVGYRRGGRSLLLHQAVSLPAGVGRRVLLPREKHVLGLVEAVGAPALGTRLELYVTPEEEAAARAALAAHGIAEGEPFAALAPGASFGPSKLWPAASFARVGDALAAAGARVVLVGGPSEAPLARAVASEMKAPAADTTAGATLGSLKALLRRARVLVCNDAGARHVAVAFGVPCVVIFGPTALEKTNLNLERVTALWEEVDCRPCYRRTCPIDHRCMARLAPERVIAAALPALDT
jgi:heptosyltransferase-2